MRLSARFLLRAAGKLITMMYSGHECIPVIQLAATYGSPSTRGAPPGPADPFCPGISAAGKLRAMRWRRAQGNRDVCLISLIPTVRYILS